MQDHLSQVQIYHDRLPEYQSYHGNFQIGWTTEADEMCAEISFEALWRYSCGKCWIGFAAKHCMVLLLLCSQTIQ